MKKGVIVMILAAVLMTGCGDMPYGPTNPQGTVVESEVIADAFRTVTEKEKGEKTDAGATSGAVQVSEGPAAGGEAEAAREPEANRESAAAPVHVCSMDNGSTVTVLAFGEQEPDCFYGAKYNVKCRDCDKILDVIYREPLGHAGNEGEVTCWPDCTGGGSIRYTCVRCGAEWSEAYGQVQPHTWVEGSRKETDWLHGGTKEVPYRYCSVCGQREESE